VAGRQRRAARIDGQETAGAEEGEAQVGEVGQAGRWGGIAGVNFQDVNLIDGLTIQYEHPFPFAPDRSPAGTLRENLPSGLLSPRCEWYTTTPHRSDQSTGVRNPRCAFLVACDSFRLSGRNSRAVSPGLYERVIHLLRLYHIMWYSRRRKVPICSPELRGDHGYSMNLAISRGGCART
jgi:hypothetical protein